MKMRIAGIVDDSIVDGDGLRLSVFTQGCPHHCVGCQNPDTHAASGGRDEDTENILARIDENPLLTGITFSGGEPFLQPAPLTRLAKEAHKRGLDVWSYTGYTLEELLAKKNPAIDALLRELDVLVDGPYEERLRDLTLNFRGSSNQRIIDMNAFRKTGKIRTLEF
ncbi:MAG: anaerobic ribonucleoside-triphosphate reductase activating protein [Selenomonas sp.]|jgi:anaerobic ribonucleoside-triphosphate reductase activating protein|uniref:anaerobic ribonucleoside-triphosphate reductase activating protein n=1 Tax=Selenomonas sp. AE3005 TaxID=1485543 RepID=UPI0004873DE0|nr:anaerobic ribonucleoside-triphosphate reductase activating protein [Selenomonas sp. AE3005]MBQ1615173.1 anaerobic ribonucleoside-triphosphate reductase activating protein [Selenomonas sp.]MBQ2088119.1 anaerobic ribonucleoside-triphosphate reductase activating protein [Selenomonas sp.]MBQ4213140.1 anaerobic ribonucleoside-triphosphate reductase activating protein [Selenomonas sp.]MBQ5501115.1 anaerobic ribonucleoside-triphosphate reductase activating protein [Selenomonas sp.]